MLDENGELEGQQYITDIGRIDILCTDKKTNDFVVIELKKGKSSDVVVGQTTRYMGWVKKHLATEEQDVKGIIIVGEPDKKLEYSLEYTLDIELLTYRVTFTLE